MRSPGVETGKSHWDDDHFHCDSGFVSSFSCTSESCVHLLCWLGSGGIFARSSRTVKTDETRPMMLASGTQCSLLAAFAAVPKKLSPEHDHCATKPEPHRAMRILEKSYLLYICLISAAGNLSGCSICVSAE